MDKEKEKIQQEELEKIQEEMKQRAESNKRIIMAMVEEKRLPTPRPLTRKERKAIDEKGLNIFKIRSDDKRSIASVRDELFDHILDEVFSGFDFDDLPNNVASWFADYVFSITYRDDLAEKN